MLLKIQLHKFNLLLMIWLLEYPMLLDIFFLNKVNSDQQKRKDTAKHWQMLKKDMTMK